MPNRRPNLENTLPCAGGWLYGSILNLLDVPDEGAEGEACEEGKGDMRHEWT